VPELTAQGFCFNLQTCRLFKKNKGTYKYSKGREMKMENICAGDVMIPLGQYPHIPYWFTLRQAILELEKSEIERDGRKSLPRAVLVFNEAYELLGIVRRRDILKGLEPKFLLHKPLQYRKKLFDVKVDPNLSLLSSDDLWKGVLEQAERQVSEIMSPIEHTVNFEDHIFKVIYEMNEKRMNLVPVMKGSSVVGVVRTVDIFHQVAKMLHIA